MHNQTPSYVKRNSTIAGIMLLPFFAALIANGLDKLINKQTLYHSWLWHTPIIAIWVLYLPILAFLVAGGSYLTYVARHDAHKSIIKRLTNVLQTWPMLITLIVSFGILSIILFHDSVHCWLKSPVHVATHLGATWQCSEANRTNIPKLINKAF